MELVFLGTRGDLEKKTRRHRRHSALLIKEVNARVLIDCGADWLGRIEALRPTAIVMTHGHADHACALANGAPCTVYATAETWQLLAAYPISKRQIMPERKPIDVCGICFEAFPVEHSILAPAVGYALPPTGEAHSMYRTLSRSAIRRRHCAESSFISATAHR